MRLLIGFFILTSACSHAQDTTKPNNLIIRRWPNWTQNDQRLNQYALKAELYKVPAAIPYYKKAQTNKIFAYSFFAATVGLSFLTKNARNNRTDETVYLVAGLASSVSALYFILRHNKNIKLAVELYNKQQYLVY